METVKKYYTFTKEAYSFNEPYVYRFENSWGEKCSLGVLVPWCQCRRTKEDEREQAGAWLVCPKCKQPDKEELTECPSCGRLWRGPKPNFRFALDCYECE